MLAEVQRELPGPWRLADFCDWLSRRRGKPLELVPMRATPKADSAHGWVVIDKNVDTIGYPGSIHTPRGQVTVYHESSHLLLGHKGDACERATLRKLVAPDLDQAFVDRVLGQPGGIDHAAFRSLIAPDIDPALVERVLRSIDDDELEVLGRTDYERPQEQEAELLGMALRRNDVDYLGIRSADPKVAARVGRARRMLRGH